MQNKEYGMREMKTPIEADAPGRVGLVSIRTPQSKIRNQNVSPFQPHIPCFTSMNLT
jgi:hypothetical protein